MNTYAIIVKMDDESAKELEALINKAKTIAFNPLGEHTMQTRTQVIGLTKYMMDECECCVK